EAVRHVGHPATRSRGTIGGSPPPPGPPPPPPPGPPAPHGQALAPRPRGERTNAAAGAFTRPLTTPPAPPRPLPPVGPPPPRPPPGTRFSPLSSCPARARVRSASQSWLAATATSPWGGLPCCWTRRELFCSVSAVGPSGQPRRSGHWTRARPPARQPSLRLAI